ncbi:hypothetical protein [Aurantiacibacter spongiae]|uniref:Uncharacterized protein n=1 Tax=Aurantiacibacter spongiae TaxID=2488860 RepID=A0A3N5DFM4_9SPHN|nr:hypothetical protein [Aurantiacibacter spongiae]RPF70452.1 hypothetical protein EG799_01515 [Aurantiacibacter spongiae]
MTASQPRIAVIQAWTDIVAGNASLGGVEVLIQNLDDEIVEVVFGGNPNTTALGPVRIDTGQVISGTATAIWVRGEGYISATVR